MGRILAQVPANLDEAWEVWRQFRSAQAEITSVFAVESIFQGKVDAIEVSKHGFRKPCDIRAQFPPYSELYIEVKAQSGQQYGDKHPLSGEPIGFTPQFESDLQSWLFEQKVSSKTGKPMKPHCLQAAEKSADILMTITDIFLQERGDLLSLARQLSPDQVRTVQKTTSGEVKCNLLIVEGGEETSRKMCGVKEVWVMNTSRLEEMLVIHSMGDNSIHGTNA